MELLEVFEVDLVQGWATRILQASERGVKPRLRVFKVVNDFVFLFHLQSVIFRCFLDDIFQVLHLLSIKGVSAFAFLQYVIEVPP